MNTAKAASLANPAEHRVLQSAKAGLDSHVTSHCKQPRREKRRRYTKIMNTLHIYLSVTPFHLGVGWSREFQEGKRLNEVLLFFCREQACFLGAAVHLHQPRLSTSFSTIISSGSQVFYSRTFAHSANAKVSCTDSSPLRSPLCPRVSQYTSGSLATASFPK